MYNVEDGYEWLKANIESCSLPSQLKSVLNLIENFEVLYGKDKAEDLRKLAIDKLNTFE